MLLDLFFRAAPVGRKRRVHFHAFMTEVHHRLHRARKTAPGDRKRSPGDLMGGLARAIAACPVPVISAVGHETDVTVADFVADVRAPTPSAAAELVSPDAEELRAHLRTLSEACLTAMRDGLHDRGRSVAVARGRLSPTGLQGEVAGSRDRLGNLARGLRDSAARELAVRSERLDSLAERLDAVSPLGTLRRGYAIVERPEGGVVTLVRAVRATELLVVRLQDGRLHVHVESKEEQP